MQYSFSIAQVACKFHRPYFMNEFVQTQSPLSIVSRFYPSVRKSHFVNSFLFFVLLFLFARRHRELKIGLLQADDVRLSLHLSNVEIALQSVEPAILLVFSELAIIQTFAQHVIRIRVTQEKPCTDYSISCFSFLMVNKTLNAALPGVLLTTDNYWSVFFPLEIFIF